MSSKPAKCPGSIRGINDLPETEKRAIYQTLIPDWVFSRYGIDPETLMKAGQPVVRMRCPSGTRAMEISIYRQAADADPMMYLNMADTFNNQLLVLLVVMNDPDAPRFNIDVDLNGNATHLGTAARNLYAEEAALKAGLAPGQVRSGLRGFRAMLPLFEQFVQCIGHNLFLIEPMAYHNAITFERYGFSYMRGQQEMIRIDKEFRPGGELHAKLSPNNVFRQLDAWKTVRGRSWAIHDGILGYPFTGFQMYKRIGVHAGINTFPDAEW